MAGLEDLVPDILLLMLVNAPSMEVLWGFIRASPRMFAVFRDQRDIILSAVIIREIGADVLQEAQSALRSSHWSLRGIMSKKNTLEWISTYAVELSHDQPIQQTSLGAVALPLWRQHHSVRTLASLYVREKLHIATQGFRRVESEEALQGPHCYDIEDLSDTEKSRLFRAFYRFAIYGNLFFCGYGKMSEETMYAPEQCDNFLCLFPSWQIEELSCINDFVTDKVLEKWQEVEDNAYNALIAADPSTWDFDKPPYLRQGFDIFATPKYKQLHDAYHRYFATLNLPTLELLFTTPADQLLKIVEDNCDAVMAQEFLSEALDQDPCLSQWIKPKRNEHQQKVSAGVKVQFHQDSVSEANEAWLWIHEYRPCDLYVQPSHEIEIGEGLRRFGYVFWDSSRLHEAGVFEKAFVYASSCFLPLANMIIAQ
jgi:hypothetical protein